MPFRTIDAVVELSELRIALGAEVNGFYAPVGLPMRLYPAKSQTPAVKHFFANTSAWSRPHSLDRQRPPTRRVPLRVSSRESHILAFPATPSSLRRCIK